MKIFVALYKDGNPQTDACIAWGRSRQQVVDFLERDPLKRNDVNIVIEEVEEIE
jgi:hypothetical protein